MTDKHETVAILGIGTMGHGMATSALRAGIPTIVWNRTARATRDLDARGALVAPTAPEAARRATVVVTMVTDADAVVVVLRDGGVLAALAPGAILVQMSTIGVAGIERVAALVAAERPDVILLDAPVSGSKDPARARPADDLRVGAGRGQAAGDHPLRRARPADGLGRRRRDGDPAQAGGQHLARLRRRSGRCLGRSGSGTGPRDATRWSMRLEGNPLVSPWQEAKLHRIASGRLLGSVRARRSPSRTCVSPRRRPAVRLAALGCLADEWQRGGRTGPRPEGRDGGDAGARAEMGTAMIEIGYTMMCEQAGPRQLVRDVVRAEEAGFDFAVISDHYFPWLDVRVMRPTPGASSEPRPRPPTGFR